MDRAYEHARVRPYGHGSARSRAPVLVVEPALLLTFTNCDVLVSKSDTTKCFLRTLTHADIDHRRCGLHRVAPRRRADRARPSRARARLTHASGARPRLRPSLVPPPRRRARSRRRL